MKYIIQIELNVYHIVARHDMVPHVIAPSQISIIFGIYNVRWFSYIPANKIVNRKYK
jgi:hypothetical protein